MEDLRIYLAVLVTIIFSPFILGMIFFEIILFCNNDATKDIETSYKAVEGFATFKLFKLIFNKISGTDVN